MTLFQYSWLSQLDSISKYSLFSFTDEKSVDKVTQYKAGKASLYAQGKRRYDRKQSGYGGQTKPVFHKKAKTTKKIVLRLECTKVSWLFSFVPVLVTDLLGSKYYVFLTLCRWYRSVFFLYRINSNGIPLVQEEEAFGHQAMQALRAWWWQEEKESNDPVLNWTMRTQTPSTIIQIIFEVSI